MDFIQTSSVGFDHLYALFMCKKYPEFFRNVPPEANREEFEAIMSYGTEVLDLIADSGELVGWLFASLIRMTRLVQMGLLIMEEHQKKGLAVASIKAAAKFAFRDANANKLVCTCSRDDKRTMNILEKAQFLPEARLRENCYYNGKLHDELRWAMPRQRYFKLYGKE